VSPPKTSPQADGYVLNIEHTRRTLMRNAMLERRFFAEQVAEFTHPRHHPLVCFIGLEDGAITHLGLGTRGHRAAEGRRRLNVREPTKLASPVTHTSLLETLPGKFRAHVKARFDDGGLLPPASFTAVMEAVRSLVPQSNALLDRFSGGRSAAVARLSAGKRRALAYQKETVATALALAKMDTRLLQAWQPETERGEVRSFLDGLPQARLIEDQMVIHDLQSFPGFEVVKTMQPAIAVFTNHHVELTVVMANRHALEKQLGADLIYRNETFGSFVLVQYKAMEQELGGPKFRLPDAKLTEELQRMDTIWADLRSTGPDGALGGFRLKDNPFFLKLCPRIVFDPDDAGLSSGMYLPLEYWRRLEADPSIEGPRDGRAVTYGNVGRYLNNGAFADLVAGGWIGTTGPQTGIFDPAIREILATGRSVTIAVKRDLTLEEQSAAHLAADAEIEELDEDAF
jgi:hypothetical protein